MDFFKRVYVNVISVTAAAVVLPLVISPHIGDGFGGFVLMATACVVSCAMSVFWIGCSRKERTELKEFVKGRIGRW